MLPSVLTPMSREKSSGCGCLGGGCAIAIVIMCLLGGALAFGAWTTFNGLKSMTSDAPRPVPAYKATEAEVQATLAKANAFSTTFDSGKPAEITLSANELNTLIARYEPWSALRGKVFTTVENDAVSAEISLPLSQIRAFQDRYFNGNASMTFITENGKPVPGVVTIRSGDVEMPRWAMRYITSKNFVESLGIPSISAGDSIGANLTAVEIKDGKLLVRAKK